MLNTINQPNLNIDNIVKNNIPLMKWIIVKNYNIVKYQLKLYFRSVISKLLERWSSLRGRSAQDCIRVYLAVVRKWQYCGAKLFQTKVSTGTTLLSRFGLSLWCLMPLFNNISVILWRKLEYPEKHQPVASHWQALSHNVTMNGVLTHDFSGNRHRLDR